MDNKQKKKLTEADVISKFILPAIESAGWDSLTQIRQEVKLRDGKVIVCGNLGMRTTVKSADIVLYHKPNNQGVSVKKYTKIAKIFKWMSSSILVLEYKRECKAFVNCKA